MIPKRRNKNLAVILSLVWIMFQKIYCNALVSHHRHPFASPTSDKSKHHMGEGCYTTLIQGRRRQAQSANFSGFQLNGLFGAGNTADATADNSAVAPKRIINITCDSIKQGALRFTLGLYLIGQQNTPSKSSWTANQADDGDLNMYYMDKTAMFAVQLSDNSVAVDRYGSSPSLRYMLQESVMLHGLLDELESLALGCNDEGDEIKDENRLLLLSEPNKSIENAREALPARAADV